MDPSNAEREITPTPPEPEASASGAEPADPTQPAVPAQTQIPTEPAPTESTSPVAARPWIERVLASAFAGVGFHCIPTCVHRAGDWRTRHYNFERGVNCLTQVQADRGSMQRCETQSRSHSVLARVLFEPARQSTHQRIFHAIRRSRDAHELRGHPRLRRSGLLRVIGFRSARPLPGCGPA